MDDIVEWQNGRLDRVYPVVFIDAFVVKIRDGQAANRHGCDHLARKIVRPIHTCASGPQLGPRGPDRR